MKQKNTNRALMAVLGVLLIGGVLLTINLFSTSQPETSQVDALATQLEVPRVNVPILEPNIPETGIREFFNPEPEPLDEPAPGAEPAAATPPSHTPQDVPPPQQESAPTGQANGDEYEEETIPVFSAFEYGTRMAWPARGEIVMEYSTDRFIFDPTLNLYRTNAIMGIAAAKGTPVQAAAEGLITEITSTRREGNKITIDHGNGWSTTYTQLDDIIVSVGDVVVLGEVIAHVAAPTIFSSELGYNTGIRVMRDNKTINPLYMLSN